MGVFGKIGALVALVGFGLVGLGTYIVLGEPKYGLALSFMIPGLFVIIAGMLIVSVSRSNRGLDSAF